jgi:signal transduction histidine kinase
LVRILTNLIDNANHYGAGEHGQVRVDITAQRLGRGIELTVRDHGPGVAPHQLEHLTRPFARADVERNRHGGSGLGLAIVARLARRHGGELTLELPGSGGLLARVRLADAPRPLST